MRKFFVFKTPHRGGSAGHEPGRKPAAMSVLLHWLAAAFFFLALAGGLHAVYLPSGNRGLVFALHAFAGLTVLGLVVLRFVFRVLFAWPHEGPARGPLAAIAVGAGHAGLYAMMVLIPLTGWIVASGMGCCMTVPGLPHVSALSMGIGGGPGANTGAAYNVHVSLAWLSFGLILVHVAAVALHHFIYRDATLLNMLPGPVGRAAKANQPSARRRADDLTSIDQGH